MSNDKPDPLPVPMVHPVVHGGRVVAVATRRGVFLGTDLDPETRRMAAAMCLFHREVAEGRAPGPFTNARAERWARSLLASVE